MFILQIFLQALLLFIVLPVQHTKKIIQIFAHMHTAGFVSRGGFISRGQKQKKLGTDFIDNCHNLCVCQM